MFPNGVSTSTTRLLGGENQGIIRYSIQYTGCFFMGKVVETLAI